MTFVRVHLSEAHKNGEALYAQLWPSHAVNESMLCIIGIRARTSQQHVLICHILNYPRVHARSERPVMWSFLTLLPETTGELL
jgi:hypothetical protein